MRQLSRKNEALLAIADALEANTASILSANEIDKAQAIENGIDPIYIRDRIDLERRMVGIIKDVRQVVQLPDPVGEIFDDRTLDNGINITRKRTPLGVLGTIYEIASTSDG